MTALRTVARAGTALALAVLVAGCGQKLPPGYQGWVEADMIFVSPDESGRVTKLNVREGDAVEAGMQLYSVDDDLQQADLNQNKATLANAQQTYDRAASLRKTGAGTQALSIPPSRRCVSPRRGSTPRRRGCRGGRALRRSRDRPANLFPRRRDDAGATAGAVDHAAGEHEDPVFRAGAGLSETSRLRQFDVTCDNCARRSDGKDLFHRHPGRIHTAGDLQSRGA